MNTKLDLYRGNICCSQCHHIINVQNDFQDHCPYCKKHLTREEIEFWEKEAQARELRKKKFDQVEVREIPGHKEMAKDIDIDYGPNPKEEKKKKPKGDPTPDPQTVYKDWVKRQQARQTNPLEVDKEQYLWWKSANEAIEHAEPLTAEKLRKAFERKPYFIMDEEEDK